MSSPWPRACAWAGLALLAFAAWRAWPREHDRAAAQPALRVVVFDASAGTTRRRPSWELWARRALREEARAAQAADERLSVVLYGAEVRRINGGPSAEDWLERLAGRDGQTLQLDLDARGARASELDAALALIEAELLTPGRTARVLSLYVDSQYSGHNPAPRLARFERNAVTIVRHALPAASASDLVLLDLRFPPSPVVGEPLVARLDLALARGLDSDLRLELEVTHISSAGLREFSVDLPVPSQAPGVDGYAHFSRSIDLGQTPDGSSELIVRGRVLRPDGVHLPDAAPENDYARAWARAGEKRLAAIVAAPDRAAAARHWIGEYSSRWPGLQWLHLSPEELVLHAGELDLVVSYDVSLEDLPAQALQTVLERAGGWLHCGGWRLVKDFDAARLSPDAAQLSRLLPLVQVNDDREPRDVVFLVDGSGSMVGEPFDYVREALGQLVRVAPPGDELRLRFFTGTLSSVIELDSAPAHLTGTLAKIEQLDVPGGPTAILYSLEQLVNERVARERGALILMLSDGRDVNAFNTATRSADLRLAFAAQRSELRVLAAGTEPNLQFLGELVGDIEQVVQAVDLAGLGELFQREVLAESIREGELAVVLASNAEGAAGHELSEAWKQAGVPVPPAARYLRTRLREGATQLWTSAEHGEPVLAVQRVSSAWVAAWPSVTLPAWSPSYAAADELFGPLFRFLSAGSRRTSSPRLVAEARELRLLGVPDDWPARVNARFRAQLNPAQQQLLVDLEVPEIEFDLGSVAFGRELAAERTAALPGFLATLSAAASLAVEFTDERGRVLGNVGFSVPIPAELLPGGARLARGPWTAAGTTQALLAPRRVDPWAWCWGLLGALLLGISAIAGRGVAQ